MTNRFYDIPKMPYATVAELPDAVKKLSPDKQRQWMHVFNSVYAKTNSDSDAAKAAWGTVNREMQTNKEISEGTIRTISDITYYVRDNGDVVLEGIAVTSGMKSDGIDLTEDSIFNRISGMVGEDVVFDHSEGKASIVGEVTKAVVDDIKSGVGRITAVIWGETAKRFIQKKKLNALSAKFWSKLLKSGRSQVMKFGHLCLSDIDSVVDKSAVITSFREKPKEKQGENKMEGQIESLRATNKLLEEKATETEKLLVAERTKVTKLDGEVKTLNDQLVEKAKLEKTRETELKTATDELVTLRAEKRGIEIDGKIKDLEAKGCLIPAQREQIKGVLVGLEGDAHNNMLKVLEAGKVVDFNTKLRSGGKDENPKELTEDQARARYGLTIPAKG